MIKAYSTQCPSLSAVSLSNRKLNLTLPSTLKVFPLCFCCHNLMLHVSLCLSFCHCHKNCLPENSSLSLNAITSPHRSEPHIGPTAMVSVPVANSSFAHPNVGHPAASIATIVRYQHRTIQMDMCRSLSEQMKSLAVVCTVQCDDPCCRWLTPMMMME